MTANCEWAITITSTMYIDTLIRANEHLLGPTNVADCIFHRPLSVTNQGFSRKVLWLYIGLLDYYCNFLGRSLDKGFLVEEFFGFAFCSLDPILGYGKVHCKSCSQISSMRKSVEV